MQTIVFKSSDDPTLYEEVSRLRYRVFSQKLHWFSENDDGVEYDQYDELDRTTYVVIKEKEQIIAFVRLIHGSPSLTEELAGRKFDSENHLCVSRMYFAKGHNTIRVAVAMVAAIVQVGIYEDVEYYIGCTYSDFVKNQIPFPLAFPIWMERNVGNFPSVFYKSRAKALTYFIKMWKNV